MNKEKLMQAALEAKARAYAPYSNFSVGAAVLTKEGKIYTGANIENSSYSLTCCAERVAIFNALSAGEREFKALAVVGDTETPITPCGACRQVMDEFFDEHVEIILLNTKGAYRMTNIAELLPASFIFERRNNNPPKK